MNKNKINKGITLVALVVTIVVLIILATISINIIFGEEGILEKAKQSKQNMANAQVEEQEMLADTANSMEKYIAGEREYVMIEKEELESIKAEISELKQKQPILIERKWAEASEEVSANETKTIDSVSLGGYGTGKAIISYSISCDTNAKVKHLAMGISVNGVNLSQDGITNVDTASTYRRGSASGTIEYNENTNVYFYMSTDVAHKPYYSYSILLLPD